MNIVYLHGFGSRFDPDNEKVKHLQTIGEVSGLNIDYTRGFTKSFERVGQYIMRLGDSVPDVIVGTSLGGYLASHVGTVMGIPFVALNPVMIPFEALQKHIGEKKDHYDKVYKLTLSKVKTYPDFSNSGCGLILLDTDDEVLNSRETADSLKNKYNVVMFPGGDHRFQHMKESLEIIEKFVFNSQLNYSMYA